ncbi:hypothetical protein NDU88_003934 [Pleurodeles waltl]|uniref:Secreted protein n=1 Tax=Pleurodeles waltl TaxID=8319 RepID=A0AAV7M5Q3_PLEWA|nr:hypothetical protein NDU88_003934 [Pleurodeles waltl]
MLLSPRVTGVLVVLTISLENTFIKSLCKARKGRSTEKALWQAREHDASAVHWPAEAGYCQCILRVSQDQALSAEARRQIKFLHAGTGRQETSLEIGSLPPKL